jgi:hypothetical protein
MKVNGKDDIPYIMENKKCLKPPTRTVFSAAFFGQRIQAATGATGVVKFPSAISCAAATASVAQRLPHGRPKKKRVG